jgi:hypothetical protein
VTHKELLENNANEKTDCSGEVEFSHKGFWDDVDWTVYQCIACRAKIATVHPTHWWNHTLKEKSED